MKVTEVQPEACLRSTITGLGGNGKTTLAVCQPEEFGRIGYIMADKTSKRFASIPPQIRKRIIPIDLDGMAERAADGTIKRTSWLKEAFAAAQEDWKKSYPDMGVIVWDTATQTARSILRESAAKNYFSDKGPTTGEKNKDGTKIASADEAQKYAQPQMGDFGIVQQSMVLVMEWFVEQPMHVIALFQEAVSDPDPKTGEGLLFGPDVMGGKGPRIIPPIFDENLAVLVERSREGNARRRLQVMPGANRNCSVKRAIGSPVMFKEQFLDLPDTVEGIQEFWRSLVQVKAGKPNKLEAGV